MSASLQSLMVDIPVERPKRSRLRRIAAITLIVVGVAAVFAVLLAVTGVKVLFGALLTRW